MADRSLTHFLYFIIVLLGVYLYQQTQEINKLNTLLLQQNEFIQEQKKYINLLEKSFLNNYYKQNPLHLPLWTYLKYCR